MNWEAISGLHEDVKPVMNCGSMDSTAMSIPGLISSLRSAFRKAEFDAVEQSLIKREESLKKSLKIEVDRWKSKYCSMERKQGEAEMEKLELEDKLKNLEVEVDRAKMAKAKFDKQLMKVENENRDKIISLESENAEFNRENIELRAEIARLKTENTDLKRKNHDCEAKIESWTNKYAVLEDRVRRLEEELKIWVEKMRSGNPISDEAISAENLEKEVTVEKSEDENSVQRTNVLAPQIHGRTSPGANSACNSPSRSLKMEGNSNVIELSDSDDSGSKDDDNDTIPIGKLKRKKIDDSTLDSHRLVNLRSNNPDNVGTIRQCEEKFKDSDDSSDSDLSDSHMNKLIAMLRKTKNGESKDWLSEVDMIQALENDDELCLKAVCALYRLNRGFSSIDIVRVTALAEFLLGEDKQGKVKKTALELKEHDANALNNCQELAKRYSTRLFEIYRKKEDPFFRP